MEGEEPTQAATQQIVDPRRMGQQNTGFTDDEISDIVCILYPHSQSAQSEVQRLVRERSPFIIGRDAADGVEPNYELEDRASQFQSHNTADAIAGAGGAHAIILRLSTAPKNPPAGFTFGRNPGRCDVVFTNDPLRRVSNIHFRIYVNEFGNVMIEDQSTNGTFIDSKLLAARPKPGMPRQHLASRWVLSSGSVINIFLQEHVRDLTFRVRIPRRDGAYELAYNQKVADYFARHRLPIEGGAPPVNPPLQPAQHVDLFRTAGQPLTTAGQPLTTAAATRRPPQVTTQLTAPHMVKQNSIQEWTGSGKYNKQRSVGKGAFAVVYKVTAKYDGRPYAAKELEKRHFIKNGVLDQKVENEMRIMQRLNHPNIVRYIENFDWDERLLIIIMEFVAYGDLGKFIAEHGPFNERTTQVLAVQLLSALRYLHNFNITHRDIKPDNILVNSLEPPEVKLTDFGLSKMIDSEQTFLRTFCGTLLYCAPEVYTEYLEYDETGHRTRGRPSRRAPGQRYSHAVDIWSLGGVLFFCLTGAAPYPARSVSSPSELLHRIMTTNLNIAPLRQRGVSEAGIDFIRAMLTRRPEHRATVDELQNHPWLADFGETIQASQSFDEVTDDEDNPGQSSQLSQPQYDEDDRVSDSMDEDSDQENRDIVLPPGGQAPRLFGEVGVSAIGSSGVIPEEYLNLPPGQGNLPLPGMSDPMIDEAYNSAESFSERVSAGDGPNPAGLSISQNQSMDQLQSLVEEVASQSLGGDDKKIKKNLSSPPQSMTSVDLNTSKRKPPSVETSDEFDKNTPPGKPTIKRLRSEGHVDNAITEEMIEEYKLLASMIPINPLGARSSDLPVIKSSFWTNDLASRHLDYPEMTEQQLMRFNETALARNEVFRPGKTPLWALAMKYFPPTPRHIPQVMDSATLPSRDSTPRAGEMPALGSDGSQDVPRFSQLVVPISTSEMAAMFESDLTSGIRDISIPVTEPLVSFGRGPENTNVYEHKTVTKVPKYAFRALLWKEGYDPGDPKLPWRENLSEEEQNAFFFWISTKATNGIRINGRSLRSSSFKSPHDPSQNWTRLFNGDSIVIWHDGTGADETKLTFRCTWGGSAAMRDMINAPGLDMAPAHIVHRLNSGCRHFEAQRHSNRMHRKDAADTAIRRRNVEQERQRNVRFDEKRQEAIAFLTARQKQEAASRWHSPATTTTTATAKASRW
ncbi:Serine/threonine-protein kinase domain protein [Cordyceps fumosorosea ARSEF 2679]|uniref:Serine/threonine-protein kinase domain protein n=1 Tax=Cordyceps fumosorosea (strain ARSEF 2679) TaxID=1081104 RepID=A0A168DXD1_CORFA|nr:Serine/threonine-protein kinase domain protein [Cordyceps fumosorosea ARSEF 2679]OAA73118.1 Serine/threonine-protein kinase domain protein [Cordyceps fumosorosea ARSEF 2679]